MALGRGLASLIPNRRAQEADEAVEEISSMEVIEEAPQAAQAQDTTQEKTEAIGVPIFEESEDDGFEPLQNVATQAQMKEEEVAEEVDEPISNTFDDFGQLESTDDDMPMPDKPLVTPLELDEVEDADLIAVAKQAAQHTQSVHQSRMRVATPAPTPVAEEDVETELEVSPPIIEPEIEKEENEPIESVQEEEVEPVATAVAETKEKPVASAEVKEAPKASVAVSDDEKWDKHEGKVEHIPLGDITINPFQPRRHFDPAELAELKDSIEQHGILQPLVVTRLSSGKYELIAGERRLRATKELKWTKVPAVVRKDVASNQSRLVFALIENIQRENLNPIELAMAYQQLHDEYGLSHEEIGQRMGKARVSVTNALRVLQLPAEVQRGLMDGKISSGHARAILMIPDEEKQIRFYKHLLDEGLTVRKAETRARRIQRTMGVHDPQRNRRRNRHPLANKYGSELEGRYGTDVNVRFSDERNRFEVVLKAYSAEDFELLMGRLLGKVELPSPPEESVEEDED